MAIKDVPAKRLVVNAKWCKGCGICVEFCPKHVLALVSGKVSIDEPELCIKCALCEMRCPDYAIWVEEVKDNG